MKAELISVHPIWDAAPHNAFTTLVMFDGRFYCAFREGEGHACDNGRLRLLASDEGTQWVSVASLESPHEVLTDLRDPKLCVLPDGRLMLFAVATARPRSVPQKNYVWLSPNGEDWGSPEALSVEGEWLWSVATEGEDLYFAAYAPPKKAAGIILYRSHGLREMETLTELCGNACRPNETALDLYQGEAIAVIRRELAEGQTSTPPFNNGTALLATSLAPYIDWKVSDLGFYVGGPALLRLPGGEIVVSGRQIVNGEHRCALWELDLRRRQLMELLVFPAAGDCSYPGLVWHQGRLCVSYYSSHEGRSRIYFAEVKLISESIASQSGRPTEALSV